VYYENVEITLEMEAGAHTVHNLYYHVVWVPKYRRSILQGKVGERAEQVIRRVADEYGYTLDELKVSPDHIHVLLKLQPKQAIPDVVRTLKSITARTLFQEFPDLKRHLWEGRLWAGGYCVNTVGGLNLDAVRKYIREEQQEALP
jgi:putative transposase